MAEIGKSKLNCHHGGFIVCLVSLLLCRSIFKSCGGFVIFGELYPVKLKIKGCHIIVNRLIYWYFDCVCLHLDLCCWMFPGSGGPGGVTSHFNSRRWRETKVSPLINFPFQRWRGAEKSCQELLHYETSRKRQTNMKTRDEENVFGVLRAVSWWLGVWMVVLWLRFNEYWSWDHVSARHPGIISK